MLKQSVLWTLVFAALGFCLALSLNLSDGVTVVATLIGSAVGLDLVLWFEYFEIDEFFIGIVAWLVGWTIGGIAIGNLALGLPVWATSLVAVAVCIIGCPVGFVLLGFLIERDEKKHERMEDTAAMYGGASVQVH